jgi:hypothetical protein
MINDPTGGGGLAPDELTPWAALDATQTPAELEVEAQAAADGESGGPASAVRPRRSSGRPVRAPRRRRRDAYAQGPWQLTRHRGDRTRG